MIVAKDSWIEDLSIRYFYFSADKRAKELLDLEKKML